MNIPEWIKPAAWGAAAGAVAIIVVSTSAGWLVTSGSAMEQAETQADQAVITALTPICVAQFTSVDESRRGQHIAALEEESSWNQGDYIEENGWATMPGSEEPNGELAEACAEQLLDASEG
ncbi:hypothetical protein [Pararhizobium haloflavum]|uniref:hypothetical protein n=1 Tax=Pararhizobium haloflavum TaxID=2037914 RepID=UPI000C176F21|nr:hypothetical protein [Pararhizobium haloflavum]